MKTLTSLAAIALMTVAAPAFAQSAPAAGTAAPAQAAPSVTAGQKIFDTAGGEVGTVEKIEGNVAVVSTGTSSVGLPLTSFAAGDKGPVISMTRDQLNSAASSAQASAAAKTAAAITAGATVKDTSGGTVGTIKSVEGQYALLDTTKVQVKLPLTAFASQPDGLVVGMTKAEIEAAAAASAPATASAQ